MNSSASAPSGNPLVRTSGLPDFANITPDHVEPAVTWMIAELERDIEAIESNVEPTWDGLMAPLERLGILFEYVWNPVRHLLGVKNSEPLREAFQKMQPEVVKLGLRLSQSKPIYDGMVALKEGDAWAGLNEAQQRVVDLKLREAKLAGVGLEGKDKDRFLEIAQELSQISTDYGNNVLDATKAFQMIVTDGAKTEGWPNTLRQVAAQSYNQAKDDDAPEATPEGGPWRITLDVPSLVPFLQHHRDRADRERLLLAHMSRASDGKLDNTENVSRILELRREMAGLLDFSTYADQSLESKMAPDVDAVEQMFDELMAASKEHARKDLDELRELARKSGQSEELVHWDVPFWAERLREQRFDYTDDELRPYFPMPRVLDGLFSLCNRLFGITVKESEVPVSVWNEDVKFFNVYGESGDHIASFYLDPYSRPAEKQGGAWMDECLSRRWVDDELRLPVIHLTCNGTPPVGDTPSLMSFSEVTTLFHEFGHGLQGMLTTVDVAEAAGVNGVEWDAVELASQFMENWCYHKPTLLGMTAHVETGEPMPDDLFEKVKAARTYRAGSDMMRQLMLGKTDMTLHSTFDPNGDVTPLEVQRQVEEMTATLPPHPENRLLCAFGHIFAGGYAAGYYSYKWAEVLSADAFAAFEEVGLDNDAAVQQLGRRYRDTVLALGGGRHPMDVYRDFRGREPSTEALLRHNGLLVG